MRRKTRPGLLMVNPSTVIEKKHLEAKARVGYFKVVID
jgi:hypothetical protein